MRPSRLHRKSGGIAPIDRFAQVVRAEWIGSPESIGNKIVLGPRTLRRPGFPVTWLHLSPRVRLSVRKADTKFWPTSTGIRRKAGANVGHPSSSEAFLAGTKENVSWRYAGGRIQRWSAPSRRLLAFFAALSALVYRPPLSCACAWQMPTAFPMRTGPLIVYANHASWWDPLSLHRDFAPLSAPRLPLWAHGRRCLEALRIAPQAGPVSRRKLEPPAEPPSSSALRARSSPRRTPFSGSPLRGASPTCAPAPRSSAPAWLRWLRGSAHALWCLWPSSTPFGMSACRRS